jgi:hypothetical protein
MSRRIKHSVGIAGFETPDLCDLAILDPDVGLIARDSRAVDNHTVFDDGVEFSHDSHLLRSAWGRTTGQASRLSALVELHLNQRPTNLFPRPFGPSTSMETICQ